MADEPVGAEGIEYPSAPGGSASPRELPRTKELPNCTWTRSSAKSDHYERISATISGFIGAPHLIPCNDP